MRHNENARKILVKKKDLIAKIKENKVAHQKDYMEAVEAFKVEAKKQLDEQTIKLASGQFDLRLSLTRPVDNSEEYDKLVTMFEWELKEDVELSQGEFNEYILDELPSSVHARMSNALYKMKSL